MTREEQIKSDEGTVVNEQDKQLLLKDLSARLPYGVFVHTWYDKPLDIKCTGMDLYTNTINLDIPDDDNAKVYIDNCKPYLRPMSSMTDKEKDYVIHLADLPCAAQICEKKVDFFLSHHIDWRGLLPKGLALPAQDGMYND